SASTGSVSLGGTASDNSGVEQVTWVNSRGGGGAASGTTNWSTGPIALQAGSNVITVTARDAAGNTSSDALTVTYAAPVITAASVSPNAGSGAAQTFTFTFADTAG